MMHIPSKKLAVIFKKFGVEAAYLFGSQISGRTHAKSDVDIAVRFSRKPSLKTSLLLANELTLTLSRPVDLMDLEEAPLPVQFRVFQARKILFAKNPKDEALKRAKIFSRYHDQKYYYDRFRKFEMDRILTQGIV